MTDDYQHRIAQWAEWLADATLTDDQAQGFACVSCGHNQIRRDYSPRPFVVIGYGAPGVSSHLFACVPCDEAGAHRITGIEITDDPNMPAVVRVRGTGGGNLTTEVLAAVVEHAHPGHNMANGYLVMPDRLRADRDAAADPLVRDMLQSVAAANRAPRDWHCEAYGPEAAAVGVRCYFESARGACALPSECAHNMATERQRVFARINELAAAGDETGAYLSGEFTNPDQLLNADRDGTDDGDELPTLTELMHPGPIGRRATERYAEHMAAAVEALNPHDIAGMLGVDLTPMPGGFCIKRLDAHRCVDVVEQLYNWRLVVTERPADRPHDGYETIEQGWCYYGHGETSPGVPRTKRTAFVAAVMAAVQWDGQGPPLGADKRAGA